MASLLKDQLGPHTVSALAKHLSHVCSLPQQAMLAQAKKLDWSSLELKERWRALAHLLQQHVPGEYDQQVQSLTEVAHHFKGLEAFVFPEFVDLFGRGQWQTSLAAIEIFTQYSTGEFAVRWYLIQDQARMLARMQEWAVHANVHLRRLASEGCRPRLPWGQKLPALIKDPGPIVPILKTLCSDPELYVRKSVANNLNDISKDHPDMALSLGRDWVRGTVHSRWIAKHGMRTLLKQGNQKALALFGTHQSDHLQGRMQARAKKLRIGESSLIDFHLTVKGNKAATVRLEFAIHYVRKNGQSSRKVFKLKELELEPGDYHWQKNISFKPLSTRQLYPGPHRIDFLGNGKVLAGLELEIIGRRKT